MQYQKGNGRDFFVWTGERIEKAAQDRQYMKKAQGVLISLGGGKKLAATQARNISTCPWDLLPDVPFPQK